MPRRSNRQIWSERVDAAVRSHGGNIAAAARDLNLSDEIIRRAYNDVQEWGIDNTDEDRIKGYLQKSQYAEEVYHHDTERNTHITDYKYLPGQKLPIDQTADEITDKKKFQVVIKTPTRYYSTPVMGSYGDAQNAAEAIMDEYTDDDAYAEGEYEEYIREFDLSDFEYEE